jgi:putative ABC transport system permease protein
MSGYRARASLEQIVGDVSFTMRSLTRVPAFTTTVIATLAIGIGVATAMFSLTAWVLVYDSPFPDGHELHAIGYRDKQSPFVPIRFGMHFDAYREQTNLFTEFAIVARERANVVIGVEPTTAEVLNINPDTFKVLNITPSLGRGFLPGEVVAGANQVIVISDRFWRQQFNADPNVLGRSAQINQQIFTVVGVLSRNQKYPPTFKGDVYRPLIYTFNPQKFYEPALNIIGRLRPGITPEQASEILGGVSLPPIPQWAAAYLSELKTVVAPLKLGATAHGWVLLSGSLLLFGISCVNAMNLMLVRLIGREKELSIRLAIGGSRWQVARLVFMESIGLSAAAGFLVVVGTRWLLPPLFAFLNDDPSERFTTYLNGGALGFIVVLTTLASVMVALVPIIRVLRGSIQAGLKASGNAVGEGRGVAKVRSSIVVIQAALAVILLAGTGLMMRTFQRLYRVDLGFNPVGKVKVWVGHPPGQEKAGERRLQYFEELRKALALVPGVRAAAYGQDSLVIGAYYGTAQLNMKDGTFRPVAASFVSPDYLRTAGITLVRGEWYSGKRGDAEAVINETMARERFGDEDPIGQYFWIQIAPNVKYRVVGVARDVRYSAKATPGMHYYVPDWMYPPNVSTMLLRLDRDPPKEFAGLVRRAIYTFDPTAITLDVVSIRDVVGNSMAAERYTYMILRGLSSIALAMATIGLFSVLAYTVQTRTREFGVRMALGAMPANVIRLVMRKGLTMVAIGIGAGVIGAMGLTRFMTALLFETTPYDAAVYVAVAIVLLIAAILACWLPARRASRVDPMTALRCE